MNNTFKKIVSSMLIVFLLSGCVSIKAEDEPVEGEQTQETEGLSLDENSDSLVFEAEVTNETDQSSQNDDVADSQNDETQITDQTYEQESEEEFNVGDVSLEIEYAKDYSSASLILTYEGDGKISLYNSEDYEEAEKLGMMESVAFKDDRIEYSVTSNGVYAFVIQILDNEDNVLDTLTRTCVISDIGKEVETNLRSAKSVSALRSGSGSNESSASVNVSYTSVSTFNWTIPSDVDLGETSSFNVSIDTEDALMANYGVSVKVSSANNFRLIGEATSYAYGYTMTNSDGDTIQNNQTVLTYKSTDTDTVSETLTVDTSALASSAYSDVYSDTLTFNASFNIAPYTKLSLNNGERTVYVMAYEGNDQYLVIERNSIVNKPYYTADAACGINNATSGCDNTYENSELDTYLNATWYNGLSAAMQSAIVDASIYQEFYATNGANSTYPTEDDEGYRPYPRLWYDLGRSQTWSGATSNTITRKVFLPSIKEIYNMGVDLSSYTATRAFLTESSGSMVHLWTRDGSATNRQHELVVNYDHGSPYNRSLWGTSFGVRPAYIVDLSLIDYAIVS